MTVTAYARGNHALGICDRCGFTYKLKELKYEITLRKRSGLRVCDSCNDPDHPQSFLGEMVLQDPQALRDPRPDNYARDAGVPGISGHPVTLLNAQPSQVCTLAASSLLTSIRLAANATRKATLTADLTTLILKGDFTAVRTLSGSLTTAIRMAAAVTRTSTLTGALNATATIQRADESGNLRISEAGADVLTEESP